jgi:hypothetical protein
MRPSKSLLELTLNGIPLNLQFSFKLPNLFIFLLQLLSGHFSAAFELIPGDGGLFLRPVQ